MRGAMAAATALVLATVAGWSTASAAPAGATQSGAADGPTSAVETLAYPGAAQILASRGITLTRGDGGITLTDCGKAGSFQIKVNAITKPANPDDMICFAVPGATGYLALSIPDAYRVTTYGRSVRASLSTDQKPTETVDVPANDTKGIGESLDPKSRAVLLELRVTGSSAQLPAPQPTDPALAFAAKVNVGDGKRSCTGTLVDRYWLLTAASCFTDTPNDLSTVAAGAPKDRTTATVGRTDLTNTGAGAVVDVVELVPRQDRDLVMARLAKPVDGITPATVATTAPTAGGSLRIPGYGRTATEWVPSKLHTTTHTTGTVDPTGVDTAPAAGQAPLCQGDAGAPALRDNGGTTELAAVATRSWQGGCLDTVSTETRTGASATRVDDLGAWVKELSYRTAEVKAGTHVQIVGVNSGLWDTAVDRKTGSWLGTWSPIDSSALTAVDSVAIGDTVHVYVVGAGRVYTKDGKVGGPWGPWAEVPGGAGGVKGITAAARGNTVGLQIIGSDDAVYENLGDYGAGSWRGWVRMGDNTAKYLTSATTPDNVLHLYSVGTDSRVYTRDQLTNGQWTPWGEIPGGAVGVQGITAAARGYTVDLQIIGGIGDLFTTYGHYDLGRWDQQWQKVSDNKLKAISSSAEGNVVHVVAVNEDDKVYSRDADYNAGKWTPWVEIPGGAVGVKAITATTTG
ncbi:trypsin-like serine protease [Kitasatospora sp. NPDC005856]|uniref:trypsin-like serine protease n=1 Tax=Kitasatospora sp. NPDC005856 TaxID=3154566 RepID=UPI0033D047EC